MSLVDLIKTTAIKAVESTNPVNILFGTVYKTSPLEIEIHQKLVLPKEFLILTETVAKKELKNNDIVALIRVQGGQKYMVIDKVVDA